MGLLSAQIDTKTMVPVCRQLATTYEAGIPLLKGITHVARESRHPKVKRVFGEIANDLRGGHSLDEAIGRQREYLSPFFVQLLASGEQGGHLDVMLRDLASYFEDRLSIQRSVVSAMTYPILLLVIAFHLGSFALGLVTRVISGLNARGGGSVNLLEYVREDWFLGFLVPSYLWLGVAAAFFVFLSRMGVLRWITGAVTTHVWPVSRVTRNFAMARFFRSLALLLNSGLGIMACIRGAASVTANPYIERDLLQSVPRVKNGATLVEAFAPSRYLTPLAREMLAVAEESGNTDTHLQKAADYHLEEANHAVKRAITVFSTLIMLGVIGTVGFIIVMFWVKLYGGMFDALGV